MGLIVSHLVTMAKGKVKGLGKIAISNDLSISNVLLVESLNFNLLLVAQLCDLGFQCIFGVEAQLSAWVGYGIEGLVMLE